MPSILFTLFLSLACSNESPDISTPSSTEGSETTIKKPIGAGASTPTSSLPDLRKGLSQKGCDNGPGVHGAVSYFLGDLNISSDGSVSGSESWILYANQKWKEKDGKDCEVRWGLSGTKGAKGACGQCDFGVSLVNSLDSGSSSCPEDLTKNETGQQIRYDIKLHADGRADIYFAKSGKKVGEGYHQNGSIRYVTPQSCRWF